MALIPSDCSTVIIAPLNWGLGHATRCIPIIRQLIDNNIEVILCGDGESLTLLQQEFPSLKSEVLASYNVKYHGTTLSSILIRNGFKVLTAIIKEHRQARRLCKKYKPQLIISDSRFGFRCPDIKSIIISHQLNIQCKQPWLKCLLNNFNTRILNAFDTCWVPDSKERTLSGALSLNPNVNNQKFIGPLSRMEKGKSNGQEYDFDTAIILSGPEPARTRLERQLINHFLPSKANICLVRGTDKLPPLDNQVPAHWKTYSLASSQIINDILLSSREIISRSGYTSIMDYSHLGISAKLIPTPGQVEQMYLADFLHGKMGFTKWAG